MPRLSRLLLGSFVLVAAGCGGQVLSSSDPAGVEPADAAMDTQGADATGFDAGPDAAKGCTLNGQEIEPMDMVAGPDGCQCVCLPGGSITCFGLSCDADAGLGVCDYYGTQYPLDTVWDCSDGCNTCYCASPGQFAMTTLACASGATCDIGNGPVEQGHHVLAPDGCNLCTCWGDGSLSCTTTWFCLE